jgi:hypothetical protein
LGSTESNFSGRFSRNSSVAFRPTGKVVIESGKSFLAVDATGPIKCSQQFFLATPTKLQGFHRNLTPTVFFGQGVIDNPHGFFDDR